MLPFRRILIAASTLVVVSIAGYGAHLYLRVDRPKHPLPPDDPRCPPGMAYIAGGKAPIWTDPPPEPAHIGIYRIAPMPEQQAVEMEIAAFCLDVSDVTASEYATCVHAGQCVVPPTINDHCTYGVPQWVFHPINCVSWDDADRYCKAKGKRLPLEEEWAYAAQGGPAKYKHPWGDGDGRGKACRHDWMWQETTWQVSSCAVRTFPPEWYGLFDMGGNVMNYTTHPCTEERPCDPDFAPESGFYWGADVMQEHAENSHGPSASAAAASGIRCAK